MTFTSHFFISQDFESVTSCSDFCVDRMMELKSEPSGGKSDRNGPKMPSPKLGGSNLGSQNGTTRSSSPVGNFDLAGPSMERDKDRATYLQQLIKDQKTCLSYPNVFHHVERLLAEGI